MNQRTYTVDFRDVTNFLEMHAAIFEGLEFPDYYGCNWSAFWDCITDMFGEPMLIEILGIDVIERLFDDDASKMLNILKRRKHRYPMFDEDIRIEIVQGDERIEIDDYPIKE
ncbi:MAG: barstar family protein [Oscillospiraceae bacterium]|nr:barstar family protein [Oscillospiraceae bacterium]